GWCDSSKTTACAYRSGRAERRTAPAEQPPVDATASRDQGRTRGVSKRRTFRRWTPLQPESRQRARARSGSRSRLGGPYELPLVRSRQRRVELVTIVVRIWHRVPKWKGGS